MYSQALRVVGRLISLLAVTAAAAQADPGRRVVVAWDGMRPDFIARATTPNLW